MRRGLVETLAVLDARFEVDEANAHLPLTSAPMVSSERIERRCERRVALCRDLATPSSPTAKPSTTIKTVVTTSRPE